MEGKSQEEFQTALMDEFKGVKELVEKQNLTIAEYKTALESGATKEELEAKGAEITAMQSQILEMSEKAEKAADELRELKADALRVPESKTGKSFTSLLVEKSASGLDGEQIPKTKIEAKSFGKYAVLVEADDTTIDNSQSVINSTYLSDFIPTATTDLQKWKYARYSGFNHLHAKLENVINIGDLTVTLKFGEETVVNGTGKQKLVHHGTAGFYVDQVVKIGEEELVVASIDVDLNTLTFTTATTFAHALDVGVNSDTFTFTEWCNLKPKADCDFELAEALMQTYAHMKDAPIQALRSFSILEDFIETELVRGVEKSKDVVILKAIMEDAKTSTYVSQAGQNIIDTLLNAQTVSQLEDGDASVVFLNPVDYVKLKTTKGADLQYVLGGMLLTGQNMIAGITIVKLNAIERGSYLMIDPSWLKVWYGTEMSVKSSEHHNDNFASNMVTFRVEQDMTITSKRPGANVVGDFQ